jgi:hypothetical protein
MAGRTDSGRRLLFVLVVLAFGASALVARLGYWQLARHDDLVESAHRQIYYRAEVPSQRGHGTGSSSPPTSCRRSSAPTSSTS